MKVLISLNNLIREFTEHSAFTVYRFFDDSHSDCCEVVACSFDLYFSNNENVEHLFTCLLAICTSFLDKCLFIPSVHFLIQLFVLLILSCMNCLHILEINPLPVVSFAIIFSHSESCLFILFIVSFAVQNLLSLIRFHLLIFVFISITLGGGS